MLQNIILYIIGYPGTGKYTVAQHIAQQCKVTLIHNHLINNPILSILNVGTEQARAIAWAQMDKIRDVVLDTIANYAPTEQSFIFTNQLYEDSAINLSTYQKIENLAVLRQAVFVPIKILVDLPEHERRLTTPDREKHFKVFQKEEMKRFLGRDILAPQHRNFLQLDTTSLSVEQTANAILRHVSTLRQ